MDVLLGDVAVDGHRTVVLPAPRDAGSSAPRHAMAAVPAAETLPSASARRVVLRATAVLAASSALTVVTLIAVAALVGHWG